MKILKIYIFYGGAIEPHLSNKTGGTSDELVHRCLGGDVRILWKAARDEIPAAPRQ